MRNFRRLLLFIAFLLLVISECYGNNNDGKKGVEAGGNSWIVAYKKPVNLLPATPRNNGATDWRDEIIYFIMTDRFCDGDPSNNAPFYNKNDINFYHGGDLQGIMNQVEYIKNLGATAVWITPVVENVWRNPHDPTATGYHGYWAHDFRKLDPHLGRGTDFYREFITNLHSNGLLVIQDIVTNHMGPLTYYNVGWTPGFKLNGYTKAFVANDFPDNSVAYNYTIPTEEPFNDLSSFHNHGQMDITKLTDVTNITMGDLADLSDLNTENPKIRNELVEAYAQWASYGIDGFRIDTVRHVDFAFWDIFCDQMRKRSVSKNFFQFGEAWWGYHPAIAPFTMERRMDSLLNYDLHNVMQAVFANRSNSFWTDATQQLTWELQRRGCYSRGPLNDGGNISAQDGMINFIDNHDNNRFLTDTGDSLDRLWLALTYMMTCKGIPCIYYNTENDAMGNGSDTCRMDMPDFKTTGKRTFTLIRVLAKLRKENIALRRGDISVLKDAPGSGVFAYVRNNTNSEDNIYCVLNTSDSAINPEINVQKFVKDKSILNNILYSEFGRKEKLKVQHGTIKVNMPPLSMKIFKLEK